MYQFSVYCSECHAHADAFLGPSDSSSHNAGCSMVGKDPRHALWDANTKEEQESRRRRTPETADRVAGQIALEALAKLDVLTLGTKKDPKIHKRIRFVINTALNDIKKVRS